MAVPVITVLPRPRYCIIQEESRLIQQVRSHTLLLSTKEFLNPTQLGNVYISDSNNNRVRKLTVSTGIITTIAGTGTNSYSGDNGPATSAGLYYPYGVTLDASGTF